MKIAYQIVHVILSDFAIHAARYTFFLFLVVYYFISRSYITWSNLSNFIQQTCIECLWST